MIRIYDDTYYEEIKKNLVNILRELKDTSYKVSAYSYGMNRAEVGKIINYLKGNYGYKFGKNEHAYGIGNNNAIEIIVEASDGEEHICGLLHLTNNMFGSVLAKVTDIDGQRKSELITIKGL